MRRPLPSLAALAALLLAALPAGAQPSGDGDDSLPGTQYVDHVQIDEQGRDQAGMAGSLAAVAVDSDAYDRLVDDIDTAKIEGYLARVDYAAAEQRRLDLESERARLTEERAALLEEQAQIESRLASVERAIAQLAVTGYVNGGISLLFDFSLEAEELNDTERQRTLVLELSRSQIANKEHLAQRRGWLVNEIQQRSDRLEVIAIELADESARLQELFVLSIERQQTIDRLIPELGPTRVLATVRGADFPLVVLDAYYRAELTMAAERPSCGIEWETLAGIGQVESYHGTYGGGTVSRNGQTSGSIIGIPLDGDNETLEVLDSDGGSLDGDVAVDRAVGPMQFIPSTWSFAQRDGDGRGGADPHNLYDAALAAAGYLCRSGPGLGQTGGLRPAIFTYNRSPAYVEAVLRHRAGYHELDLPPGPTGENGEP